MIESLELDERGAGDLLREVPAFVGAAQILPAE